MSDETSTQQPKSSASASVFSSYLQLEKLARQAASVESLQFTMVNETRRVFEYRQAAFVLCDDTAAPAVTTLSGIAVLDQSAPFIGWLRRLVLTLQEQKQVGQPVALNAAEAAGDLSSDWREWSPAYALWVPLKSRDEKLFGGLWLARDTAWREVDIALLASLAEVYAHAWLALAGPRRLQQTVRPHLRKTLGIGLAALAMILLFPVSQSALAPAQVVAEDPVVVAAPLEGIVNAFNVEPNQPVQKDQELFSFDDTTARNRKNIAERELQVAVAELRRATQGAFTNAESSAQVALLKSRVDLKQAELAYADSILARVVVRAMSDGVVIFNDPQEWIGRPVATGERIMLLADPTKVLLRVDLPVKQMLALQENAEIILFLDSDPLHPRKAHLVRAGYEAQPQPDGTLAYPLLAVFDDGEDLPRIGLHGTAKVYSASVPVFLYLFRRPLSELRQTLGW